MPLFVIFLVQLRASRPRPTAPVPSKMVTTESTLRQQSSLETDLRDDVSRVKSSMRSLLPRPSLQKSSDELRIEDADPFNLSQIQVKMHSQVFVEAQGNRFKVNDSEVISCEFVRQSSHLVPTSPVQVKDSQISSGLEEDQEILFHDYYRKEHPHRNSVV